MNKESLVTDFRLKEKFKINIHLYEKIHLIEARFSNNVKIFNFHLVTKKDMSKKSQFFK